MSNIDINWYPSKGGSKNGFLGNGFINSGAFRVNFTVFENSKFSCGFAIRLPGGRKNPENQEWINDVSFASREISDEVYAKIAELVKDVNGAGVTASVNVQSPSNEEVAKTASAIGRPF